MLKQIQKRLIRAAQGAQSVAAQTPKALCNQVEGLEALGVLAVGQTAKVRSNLLTALSNAMLARRRTTDNIIASFSDA